MMTSHTMTLMIPVQTLAFCVALHYILSGLQTLQRQIIQIQSLYIVYGTSEILRGLKKVEQFGIALKI